MCPRSLVLLGACWCAGCAVVESAPSPAAEPAEDGRFRPAGWLWPEDTGEAGDGPDVDVLVVGAGPAGLAAAIEAQAAGARVEVLERSGAPGGTVRWIGGSNMLFSGSPAQAAMGVEDSATRLLEEWAAITGGDPEDPWVRAFAERNVPEVYQWLVDLGLEIRLEPHLDASAGEVLRIHSVAAGPQALVDALSAAAGDVIAYGTEAVALLVDGEGRILGVRTRDGEGTEQDRRAARTVLATGGFLRDLARVRSLRPDLEAVDLWYGCGPDADGNGHALLEGVGGTWDNGGAVGLYLHGVPDPVHPGEELIVTTLSEGIWIGGDGVRFADEGVVNSLRLADTAVREVGGVAWLLLDAAVAADTHLIDPMALEGETMDVGLEDLLDAGLGVQAETLADLAAALGMDPTTLEATVAGFNAFAYGEDDDAFRPVGAPATPLEVPPFTALRLAISAAKAFGGIEVDLDGRVLDARGDPVEGVFAAGELAGMAGGSLVGDAGFTGSLSAVLLSGRVAGAAAAGEALDQGAFRSR